MPSHLVSLPGARGPATGVPLGSKLNHVSVAAVHGSTTRPSVTASKPVLAASKTPAAAPAHVVSQPKTH
uniref:Uncharacterized protein n=1 Tax=viral metagenome TaxID=1070528 RepID=A0A6C0CHK3_9ZZZZ